MNTRALARGYRQEQKRRQWDRLGKFLSWIVRRVIVLELLVLAYVLVTR